MGVEEQVRRHVEEVLHDLVASGLLPAAVASTTFAVERPERPEHGHLSTNVALATQRLAGQPPRVVAERVAERLRARPGIQSVEIAGPGFLNLRLEPSALHAILGEVLAAGAAYGRAPAVSRATSRGSRPRATACCRSPRRRSNQGGKRAGTSTRAPASSESRRSARRTAPASRSWGSRRSSAWAGWLAKAEQDEEASTRKEPGPAGTEDGGQAR